MPTMDSQQWTMKTCSKFVWTAHLEDEEVPGLDKNAQLLQLLTVLRKTHNFIVDAVLWRRA